MFLPVSIAVSDLIPSDNLISNSILPVSCYIDDYIDISDVYMSLPAVINNEGVRDILKLELNQEEQKKLKLSAQTLKNVLNEVGLN